MILIKTLNLVNCECGFPGIPEGAEFINQFSKYEENLTVSYKCNDKAYEIPYQQTRTCFKGKWSNFLGRCADESTIHKSISQILIFESKAKKILANIIPGQLNSSFGHASVVEKYPKGWALSKQNTAYDDIENDQIDKYDAKCIGSGSRRAQKWTVKLNKSSIISFIEIGMINDEVFESKDYDSFPIKVIVSPFRECRLVGRKTEDASPSYYNILIKQFVDKIRVDTKTYKTEARKQILEYLCDMTHEFSLSSPKIEESENNMPQNISISITENSFIENVILCSVRIWRFHPLKCGDPEIPFAGKVKVQEFANMRHDFYAKYSCDDGYDLEDNEIIFDNFNIYCGPDSNWIGRLPKCRPRITCPLLSHRDPTDYSRPLFEYKNTIFSDEEETAIKDSIVVFSCKRIFDKHSKTYVNMTLKGQKVITCTQNGTWNAVEPSCVQSDQDNEESENSSTILTTILVTLAGTLCAVGLIAGLTFYFFRKKFSKKQEIQKVTQNRYSCVKKEEPIYDVILEDHPHQEEAYVCMTLGPENK